MTVAMWLAQLCQHILENPGLASPAKIAETGSKTSNPVTC